MSGTVRLRSWRAEDRALGEALFDSNTPRYFAVVEKADFLAFVDDLPGPYFVLETLDGEALGCGGYARKLDAPSVAALCWGMVRGDLHGRRLGERLLAERLDRIAADPVFQTVEIKTTQHSRGFFARYGFVETAHTPDGFAPGMDLVVMTSPLDAWRARRERG
ncbi:GNAT family N-acetyltransferase [Caulobacter sp. UNC279MFTsu5.1]|uniref:GNAT family N-acetyltransferase n=1 Tax=Caulobacter sp. UNC279MFTsu5.1 TaxID=1502775 RepID=UPI0008EE4E86|nr:GNAT family N-acetyltransferase [Caulobacter sp. UNC279MFTsu5.1]SFK43904.1 Acetyltransferase (GNAT) family protein [Caulobacter sp. UNC279MFTsu5.1]